MKTIRRFILTALLIACSPTSNLLFGQWTITGAPVGCSYTSLAADSQYLFAASDSGIYRTYDGEESWLKVNNGLSSLYIGSIMYHPVDGDFYCTSQDSVYKSTDSGENWITISSSLSVSTIHHLHIRDSILFASTSSGAYRSTDGGTNWETINSGLTSPSVLVIKHKDSLLFAGIAGAGPGTGHGVFRSTDNGDSWVEKNNGITSDVSDLEILGERIYANSGTLVYSSSDDGDTWTANSSGLLSGMYISDFYVLGDYIFLSQMLAGPFIQHKDSLIWQPVSEGLGTTMYTCITTFGNNAFIGTSSQGIWHRQLTEILTGVDGVQLRNLNYILTQNYPNPFNPSTTINYKIPVGTRHAVSLRVYDVLGREITTLVNEIKPAGSYHVEWNASGFPGGVYFYRLQAGSYVETKKLILLK